MATKKGLFDRLLVNVGWFDYTQQSAGFFNIDDLDDAAPPPSTFKPQFARANVAIGSGGRVA